MLNDCGRAAGFDTILLAEIMWRPDLHEALIETVCRVLAPRGEVWVVHCHHWEGHGKADEHFFGLARGHGLGVEAMDELALEMQCLFGDETQRCFVFRMRWAAVAVG